MTLSPRREAEMARTREYEGLAKALMLSGLFHWQYNGEGNCVNDVADFLEQHLRAAQEQHTQAAVAAFKHICTELKPPALDETRDERTDAFRLGWKQAWHWYQSVIDALPADDSALQRLIADAEQRGKGDSK